MGNTTEYNLSVSFQVVSAIMELKIRVRKKASTCHWAEY